jgi:hypothetical protein
MLKEPIPVVTAEDVERIAWRDFAPDEIESVMTLLGEYDESRQESIRVRLAALKLADNNVNSDASPSQLAAAHSSLYLASREPFVCHGKGRISNLITARSLGSWPRDPTAGSRETQRPVARNDRIEESD